ncbi:MAG: porphobilinogen synthase [Myxococcota bacterium]|jgi:porphobilinogen synthase|nr:porphobilinogen synthase [Deltaproteobacteria bacterium]MCP4240884.1 porphobilinogen synthase [bacterium]MDP6075513.1 porphobilinogen synthase [Myxococcota bacterium]MDP6242824.1 porphobilinogen synthase [Myxococcota bacterium]MDP7075961.1 porphobilinogen synthase [Myxococcota bacterium]
MSFPITRLRRLRRSEALRRMLRETRLSRDDLVYPLFVVEGSGVRAPVTSMPGVFRLSVDALVIECKEVHDLGIPAVLLFGVPDEKDARGSGADAADGVVQRAVEAVKSAVPGLCVVTDVCLCEYTDHGHCGLIEDGDVANDPSLVRLAETAVSHARAGADVVAPSDMMDGRVAAIRAALDGGGFDAVPILSYAAKFASAYYGPFRDAAESTPQFGDRRSYQMDPPNAREALREMRLDLEEGADILMVKPALPYLDVLARARAEFDVPLAAYHVSGEYAMVRAAAERGWIDGDRAMHEALIAIKRAGADLILTYAAKDVAAQLVP